MISHSVAGLTALALTACAGPSLADPQPDRVLERALEALAARTDGTLGVCAMEADVRSACIHGTERFSLQSVMKLIVGAAAMEAVDRRGWRLDEPIILDRDDLSLNVQPLANVVLQTGMFRTTLGDLIERAVIESDSAASDYLFRRLGGAPALSEFLQRNGVAESIRIDRDERRLQTELTGVAWRPEFVDPAALEQARGAVPEAERRAAFTRSLTDPRDTATPESLARFLARLANGEVLSPASTQIFLNVMARTQTFPTRLRAGVPTGWRVAHKTGTSATLDGLNGVTNDVGILTAPDGRRIAIVVFLARSNEAADTRDAIIAEAARLVVEQWQ